MKPIEGLYFKTKIATKKKLAMLIGRKFPKKFEKYLNNPVFLIGCGRSGTTMLRKILSTHQDICSFSEANEIWDPEGYPWYESNLNRPPIWYDSVEYIKRWRSYFNDNNKQELKGVFGLYQYISRNKIFINKSPINTFRIIDILEIFPDSKFIHIYRDGRAVAYSWAIKQYNFIKKHEKVYRERGYYYSFNDLIRFTAKSWVSHIEEVEYQKKNLKLLDKNIFLELSYEDFCEDPRKNIKNICNYLSIKEEDLNLKNFKKVTNKNYKWKNNLNEDIILELNNIIMPILSKLYQK